MVLRVAGDLDLRTGPMIGLVLVPVAWVVTLTVPWSGRPEWCRLSLLVLDIGLVGLGRLDPVGGSALLVVVPALWLGFVYGVRGAIVTGVATVRWCRAGTALLRDERRQHLPLGHDDSAWPSMVSLAIANVIQRVRGGQETIELQRRVGEAILDTVDVGLVLLDGNGRYLTMNRRHHDFMRLAFPAGHHGVAGQLGDVFHEDGETLGPARGDADLPRDAGRGVRRPADLGRLGHPHPTGAVGLLAGRARRERARSPAPRWPTRTSPTSCGALR